MSHACQRFQNCYKTLTFYTFAHATQNHILTSKSDPRPAVFFHFSLPHVLRATHTFSTSQVLCTFWLRNVLCAITACIFSTMQFLKVLRSWGFLYILTWKCASRHNGVQLFIAHLARWLRTRRFSEPTFRPSGATNHRKNTVFRDVATFSRTCIFFLLILSLLWSSFCCCSLRWLLPPLLFRLSILSTIVGSLTSKLPSNIFFSKID